MRARALLAVAVVALCFGVALGLAIAPVVGAWREVVVVTMFSALALGFVVVWIVVEEKEGV